MPSGRGRWTVSNDGGGLGALVPAAAGFAVVAVVADWILMHESGIEEVLYGGVAVGVAGGVTVAVVAGRRVLRGGIATFYAAPERAPEPVAAAAAAPGVVNYYDQRQVHQTLNVTVAAAEPVAVEARRGVPGVVLSRSDERIRR